MKKILITGGTGFLGRNLAFYLNKQKKYKILLCARNNKINLDVFNSTGIEVTPIDICSIESIRDVFNYFKPHIVIHAAATKFVDLSEKEPMECVDVNILGSQNILRVSLQKNIETLIGISTDKAAPPVGNIYGHSKAIMERMFTSMSKKTKTKIACVRFGNIAWSTNSIFPIFKEMTQNTKSIKSTGSHMRRFFFFFEDASKLVETSIININKINGGILSLKMKSTQIKSILDVWCLKYNIKWKKIPTRPGDKIDEYLIGDEEIKYCKLINLNKTPYYLIKFNEINKNNIKNAVSTKNSINLSNKEILNLINKEPKF